MRELFTKTSDQSPDRRIRGVSASVSNLHQLDGRDPQYVLVRVAVTKPEERLEPERGQLRQALTRRFRL